MRGELLQNTIPRRMVVMTRRSIEKIFHRVWWAFFENMENLWIANILVTFVTLKVGVDRSLLGTMETSLPVAIGVLV